MMFRLAAFFCLFPLVAQALSLEFPETATRGFQADPVFGTYAVASAPFDGTSVPTVSASGTVIKTVWRFSNQGLTTFQMLDPLAEQLETDGFRIVFTCESQGCGGFDFRFGIDLLPAPDMYVDLGDFRYLAARRPSVDGDEYVTFLVSRTASTGFVHLVSVTNKPPATHAIPSTKTVENPISSDPENTLVQQLETHGHLVLSDLTFETGSSTLGPQTFTSLTRLADYLNTRPDRRVALVGHTDAQGSLAGNIALSKRRATAVRDRLIETHNVDPAQLEAEGVGYLAPMTTNLTSEGREINRRVEVILRSIE